jgi:Domain of unknown function (DUF4157)
MSIFRMEPRATRQTDPVGSVKDSPTPLGQRHDAHSTPLLQRATQGAAHFDHDFSRIPVHRAEPAARWRPLTSPGSGAPLDIKARERFEPGLGASLANVRVHADEQAAASAEALGAEAYTVGHHIIFGAGRYRPDSTEGQRLLAHELTHVVQQQGRAPVTSALPVSSPDAAAEREASRAAEALAAGRPVSFALRPSPPAIYRQPRQQQRADRFLPNEKAQLKRMGRGELDDLIDQIIADGRFHRVRQQTIDGVEHVWEVKTAIVELSEKEQMEGASFGGALTPETVVTSPDGKKKTHQFTYILRGGRASSIESALHELIHLRINIDRTLPAKERSSFYSGYSQLTEMTEVMGGTKFGAGGDIGKKSSYGALSIVAGNWEQVSFVLRKIEALRTFYIGQDANAEKRFDSKPENTPAALIEFIVHEKYVTQTAARAVSPTGSAPSNETVANRYKRMVDGRFFGLLAEPTQTRINSSPVGIRQRNDMVEELGLAIRRLYDALDKSLAQAREFEKNPPKPPADMKPSRTYEPRPLGIGGNPIPAPLE